MNGKTSKLLTSYAKECGRTRKDIKDWWKSLVEEDKARARRSMTILVESQRKEQMGRATKSVRKEEPS